MPLGSLDLQHCYSVLIYDDFSKKSSRYFPYLCVCVCVRACVHVWCAVVCVCVCVCVCVYCVYL